MFELRPYQTTMVDNTRQALKKHRAVLLQAPTGAGKTAIGANMVHSAVQKGNPCYFVVHRQELIEQSMEAFKFQGIEFGVVAAGYQPNPFQPVQICSIDTLKNRIDRLPIRPKVVLWDECHHVAAAGWAKVFEEYKDARHVGLSATPERLDGQGLGDYFTYMVKGPSIRWLIDEGYLVGFRIYGSNTTPDLSTLSSSGHADYAKGELADAMDKPTITGDAIQHYLKYAAGKSFISFGTSKKHSEHIAEQFRAAGVMGIHIDSDTDKGDRRLAMQGFKARNITGLSNVGLFGEGVDVPAVECLIDIAPSKSLSKVMQMWGRVLRPVYAKGYDLSTKAGRLAAIAASMKPYAIILDHAGNWKRHGFPDDDREWSLDSKKRKKKNGDAAINSRQCTNCYHIHGRSPSCPMCGFIYPIQAREIDYVEGNLSELTREQRKDQNREQLRKAKTFPELLTLGIMWGIPNPELWAERIIADRKAYAKNQVKNYYARKNNS